jgi:hypothetical protein
MSVAADSPLLVVVLQPDNSRLPYASAAALAVTKCLLCIVVLRQ